MCVWRETKRCIIKNAMYNLIGSSFTNKSSGGLLFLILKTSTSHVRADLRIIGHVPSNDGYMCGSSPCVSWRNWISCSEWSIKWVNEISMGLCFLIISTTTRHVMVDSSVSGDVLLNDGYMCGPPASSWPRNRIRWFDRSNEVERWNCRSRFLPHFETMLVLRFSRFWSLGDALLKDQHTEVLGLSYNSEVLSGHLICELRWIDNLLHRSHLVNSRKEWLFRRLFRDRCIIS